MYVFVHYRDVHGFSEENITILMDDESGNYQMPTKDNIMAAYAKIVEESESGDAIFCHYSGELVCSFLFAAIKAIESAHQLFDIIGHGAKIQDDDYGEEEDNADESLVPVDYNEAGVIRDDDLYNILVRPLAQDVTLTCVMDCCHSGTVLDLPYVFKPDGNFERGMEIDEKFNFGKLFKKIGANVDDLFNDDE